MRLPIRTVVAAAAIAALGAGCCCEDEHENGPATYVVYIDGDCRPETAVGEPYGHLLLYPGDALIFVNTRTDNDISITFTDPAVFGMSSLDVPKGKRRKVEVPDSAIGDDTTFSVGSGCTVATTLPTGDPDVKVGECP